MKRGKSSAALQPVSKAVAAGATLTGAPGIRYVDGAPAIPAVPCTIHAPVDGGVVMADRAYVLIHVLPGQTSAVVRSLREIKQIKTVDPCWGKPDIITVVEVSDQDALTQLVLSRIHAIEGVTQTDTHLVYRLKEAKIR
ncbi:putative Transcriptional regulator, AsnC family [Nitrospira sp. KM1]|uniref:Lrp/AsnC ligand binding domain-containing protein n=1 Tax=Nitrospira sp. KM1 TaxID=1936990 RepID=UPI0013A73FA9|nr:Lrp/AsnC ligand binding domain-containing protein [Nitrospira sp. KM1]BCA56647.1 putative Transcriptional regulator, AsnC family [Nitrospira sp. KM1]